MDLRSKGPIIGMVLAAAVAIAAVVYKVWPATLPNVVFEDEAGERTDLATMGAGKEYLVLVMLLQGCPVSKLSVDLLKKEHEQWSEKAAFAGLFLGTAATAAEYQEQQEIPFPVVGLRSATDPFAVNELFEKVGSSYGTGSAVYGGTVIVVDGDLSVAEVLEKEDVRTVPEELRSLLE